MRIKPIASACLITLVAGCTQNVIVVGNGQTPDARRAHYAAVAPHCSVTAEERAKYSKPVPLLEAREPRPAKAKEEHVEGCAMVEFQLDNKGHPINLHVVKEWPTGYGFADATKNKLSKDTFEVPDDLHKWFSLTSTYLTI